MPETAVAADSHATDRLRTFVDQYRICFEVHKISLKIGDELRQVGYELDLFGTHEGMEHCVVSSCERCHLVYGALTEIAHWIVPREFRPSRYEIEASPVALSFSPRRRFRPDLRLTLDVLHRDAFDAAIDECETLCLEEMKATLRKLGAHGEG